MAIINERLGGQREFLESSSDEVGAQIPHEESGKETPQHESAACPNNFDDWTIN